MDGAENYIPTRGELKAQALAGLKGNWGFACGVWLTYVGMIVLFMVLGNMMGEFFAGLIKLSVNLVMFPLFTIGVSWTFLDFVRGNDVRVSNLFKPFSPFYFRGWGACFLISLYTQLWVLLFIIPGFVKHIAYSQTFYILKDNPQLSANQAIGYSSIMMYGHKKEYLVLCFSFLGWFILSILTLGIGLIWLAPYCSTTMALFYDNLKKSQPDLIAAGNKTTN